MKRTWIGGFFVVLLTLCVACNNETSSIGLYLTDQLGTDFTDTVSVTAYSTLEDTLNTTKLTANLVGDLYDPVFGNSSAATYAQFDLTGSSVNFGESPVVDSVVLTLQLASFYGDTNSRVDIRVFQLTEPLSSATTYYSNSTLSYDNTPLNYSLNGYRIRPNTNVIVDTGIYSPHLRIRLSQRFGQYLLDNQSHMTSNAAFKDFFKGLCISATSHTGSTGYILVTSMVSSLSGITLYYHNNSKATAKYVFPCNNECARFTNFKHNYTTSTDNDFIQEVLNGNRELGGNKLYLQGSAGVKARITFPHLREAFKSIDNRVVINRAELVIADVSPEEQYLVSPASLAVQGIHKDNGNLYYIPDDEYFTSASYYGGTYDATKHEYRFRITRYVQDYIQEKGDLTNTLNLVVKGATVRPNRLIMGGTRLPLDDNRRLRLELSYTVY